MLFLTNEPAKKAEKNIKKYIGEIGNNGYAEFWGVNKMHYGLC